jgi:hemerythrin superfamily protein
MQATERDVISVLTRDHRQVQELFDRLQPVREPGERRRLADEVTIMLVRHAVAEEKYLFPVLRKVPGGDTITQEAIADHAAIEKALKHLYETDPAGIEFDVVLSKLLVHVHSHINNDEKILFTRLADHFTNNALIELGNRMQSTMDKTPAWQRADRVHLHARTHVHGEALDP